MDLGSSFLGTVRGDEAGHAIPGHAMTAAEAIELGALALYGRVDLLLKLPCPPPNQEAEEEPTQFDQRGLDRGKHAALRSCPGWS